MRVLVACEFSGIVRDAFASRGHDVTSCDLLPTERPGNHYHGDVREIIGNGWDMMIAHPPCTYLSNSGVRWLVEQRLYGERWRKMRHAAEFFRLLLDAPIARIAVENPVMHGYAAEIIRRPHSHSIQPWEFGHGEIKRTCLWLKRLPLLRPTNIVEGREPRVHYASAGPDRWKERSRTLSGIADAMADQWGKLPAVPDIRQRDLFSTI